jgi:4'-phosphopantetheinyl transferase
MDVYWWEQTEADVPVENDWLTAGELVRLEAMHVAKRRADWRLGRWTAKQAVAACLNLPDLRGIEIRAGPDGAPEAVLENERAGVEISISHRGGVAACAVTSPGTAVGCDLEMIEPHSEAFVAQFFHAEEQALIAGASAESQSLLTALIWSAKESVLKALRLGLRVDTRCLIVDPLETCGIPGWRPLSVRQVDGLEFRGWWQRTGDLVRTLIVVPPAAHSDAYAAERATTSRGSVQPAGALR